MGAVPWDGSTPLSPLPAAPRVPAGDQRAGLGRAGEGDSSCRMQMSWARAGRRSGEQRSLGGGGARRQRGDRAWKRQDWGCARAQEVGEDGEQPDRGGWGSGWGRKVGAGEGGTLTRDGKVCSGLSGAGAREAGWDRPGGVSARPGPLFPRSHPTSHPTPPRAGVHSWLRWTTYPRLRSRVGPLPAGRVGGRGGGRGGGGGAEESGAAGGARGLRPGSSARGLPRELCSRFISISLPRDRRLGAARARPVPWVVAEGVAP